MDSLFEALKNLGPARLGVMLLSLMGLVVFFVFIAVRSGTPTMTLLYGGLSPADSTAIAGQLDLAKIPFNIVQDGKEVMVSQRYVGKARMLLAQEGLPSNGNIGYEVFDQKQRFGTTSFVQNINKLRALEGELSRTIRTIDAIKTARVHLVLPKRELFSRESRPASASVFINLRKSNQVRDEQSLAIQHLVASAVPGLKAENVAIIDGSGNLLAKGSGSKTSLALGGNADGMRLEYEERLKSNIEEMVSSIVGYGKVRVNATADLDFDVITSNSEIYDPDGQVVRSTQSTTEDELDNSGAQAKTVTVQNNLPGLPAGGGGGASAGISNSRSEDIVNYEISKTIENVVKESGEIRKISIAVLVDGYYEDAPVAEEVEDTEVVEDVKPKQIYIQRTQEELDKIKSLVKSSIGFNEARGDTIEVINMQFASVEGFEEVEEELILGLLERSEFVEFTKTLMLSVVALLIVLLVLRPLVNHIATASKSISDQRAAEAEEGGAMLASQVESQVRLSPPNSLLEDGDSNAPDTALDVQNVEGKVKASSLKAVSDLVEGHPGETVAVIRSWMTQES